MKLVLTGSRRNSTGKILASPDRIVTLPRAGSERVVLAFVADSPLLLRRSVRG
jgi:hypothetical protein